MVSIIVFELKLENPECERGEIFLHLQSPLGKCGMKAKGN